MIPTKDSPKGSWGVFPLGSFLWDQVNWGTRGCTYVKIIVTTIIIITISIIIITIINIIIIIIIIIIIMVKGYETNKIQIGSLTY